MNIDRLIAEVAGTEETRTIQYSAEKVCALQDACVGSARAATAAAATEYWGETDAGAWRVRVSLVQEERKLSATELCALLAEEEVASKDPVRARVLREERMTITSRMQTGGNVGAACNEAVRTARMWGVEV